MTWLDRYPFIAQLQQQPGEQLLAADAEPEGACEDAPAVPPSWLIGPWTGGRRPASQATKRWVLLRGTPKEGSDAADTAAGE
jgi:hypothetical protein